MKRLKIKKASAEEVRRQLWRSEKGKGWTCDVRNLRNGAEMFIGPSRDLVSGMERNGDSSLMRFAAPSEGQIEQRPLTSH